MTSSEDPTTFWLPKELIAITVEHPYYFEPGKGFHYSNTNTIIIGEIIEMVTGNSLESEIANRIIDKLGLKNTSELQQSRLKGHEMPGSDKKYGMGIFSYDNFYGHNGGYPGFTSLMMHSSERNCTIIIWYNCQLDEATPTMLLPEVAKIIYPDIE
jgi:CubicO group peptidase (beta-lactamase class C family)